MIPSPLPLLGRALVLLLDNTTADNKNKTVLAYAAWLVETGSFDKVTLFFLPKGHTYNKLDQVFSALINSLLKSTICTPEQLWEPRISNCPPTDSPPPPHLTGSLGS